MFIFEILFGCSVFSDTKETKKGKKPDGIKRIWFNGEREEWVWMVDDEVVVFKKNKKESDEKEKNTIMSDQALADEIIPGAIIESANEKITFYKLPEKKEIKELQSVCKSLSKKTNVKHASSVFYPGFRNPESRMALTGEIIVHFKSTQTNENLDEFAKKYGLKLIRSFDFSPNTYLFDARLAEDSLDLANKIHKSGEVKYAYPNWLRSYSLDTVKKNNNDKEYDKQQVNKSTFSNEDEKRTKLNKIHRKYLPKKER